MQPPAQFFIYFLTLLTVLCLLIPATITTLKLLGKFENNAWCPIMLIAMWALGTTIFSSLFNYLAPIIGLPKL